MGLRISKRCPKLKVDTSLRDSNEENFKINGVIYVSKQNKPKKNDWIVVKENGTLSIKIYDGNSINILGKVLAQEVRY